MPALRRVGRVACRPARPCTLGAASRQAVSLAHPVWALPDEFIYLGGFKPWGSLFQTSLKHTRQAYTTFLPFFSAPTHTCPPLPPLRHLSLDRSWTLSS